MTVVDGLCVGGRKKIKVDVKRRMSNKKDLLYKVIG